ncbi:hypothetical protein AB7C87_10750 [Natrarchaeobius sp. A-rgal3]|uniref:hypothetical protein n=1 Tax=Natrarchaeobius versutus TaxID=1679078 RepID=UPI00350F4B92
MNLTPNSEDSTPPDSDDSSGGVSKTGYRLSGVAVGTVMTASLCHAIRVSPLPLESLAVVAVAGVLLAVVARVARTVGSPRPRAFVVRGCGIGMLCGPIVYAIWLAIAGVVVGS